VEVIYGLNAIKVISSRPGGGRKMTADKQFISALKAGDGVDSYFSVAYKKPVTEYKYGHMFEFRAVDRTGQITVKYWGGDDRERVKNLQNAVERGGVVRIKGEAGEYRSQLEISVSEKDGGVIEKLSPGDYDASALLATLEGIPEMRERLMRFVNAVEEPHLSRLLTDQFEDEEFMESFSACPASVQFHSAVIGGLLNHTLTVVETCSKMLQLQPGLDRDLVIAGALLHDIGKTRSYVVAANTNHTPEGNLIGHLVISYELLLDRMRSIDGFPEGLALKLKHVILSHHGRREWGSPIEPMMPEALLVHMADDMDAKLNYMVSRREEAVTEDDWTWDRRLSRLIYLR
jgi:3'-5' exoribonuclease